MTPRPLTHRPRKKRLSRRDCLIAALLVVAVTLVEGLFSCEAPDPDSSASRAATLLPDPVPGWMELPGTDDPSLCFISHPMVTGGVRARNYSFYWDSGNLVARWVAYPLNTALLEGDSSRSDAWGPDPKIPLECQPSLYNSYKGEWQRGHQIPSADRRIRKYNGETFYFTNMTPQNGSLNAGIWADLEEYVRQRAKMVDTLYVVTGCVLAGSREKALDNEGREVTVPTAYYKALLALRKGAEEDSYTGIAFWLENRAYDKDASYMRESMTISDLEMRTGVDFFVNLPSAIGAKKAAQVEENADRWWANR